MNTKNKMIALVEIVIVLCSLFLVALPAIAADQNPKMQKASASASTITTASEDDYVLGLYGNANEDDNIDMRDLTYVKLIFFGKKPETELADAKYDGKINPLDFIQIKLIIVGKEKELTIIDARGEAVTVNKPVERIVTLPTSAGDAVKVIKAGDKVVGVGSTIVQEIYFPERKLPYVAKDTWFNPDYEKIIELKPDIVLTLGRYNPESEDKLGPVGITVVRMEFNMADLMTGELKKLGYILDTEKEAEEFTNWYEGWMNKILDRTDELSDDKKPLVYGGYRDKVGGKGTFWEPAWRIAGGINIAGDLEGYSKVDPEWVLEQNPDVIVKAVPGIGGYGEDDLTKMKKQRDTIMSQPGWENVEAIKNKRVYLQTFLLHLGTHTVISVAYMAKWFHPDLFEDLDPKAVHQEYLDRFMGIDYNVYEHGVFVYPPLED